MPLQRFTVGHMPGLAKVVAPLQRFIVGRMQGLAKVVVVP
jgi:hypothetical protein